MSKEQYKEKLVRKGYEIQGDIAYLDTPYGRLQYRIIEDIRFNANAFGLLRMGTV